MHSRETFKLSPFKSATCFNRHISTDLNLKVQMIKEATNNSWCCRNSLQSYYCLVRFASKWQQLHSSFSTLSCISITQLWASAQLQMKARRNVVMLPRLLRLLNGFTNTKTWHILSCKVPRHIAREILQDPGHSETPTPSRIKVGTARTIRHIIAWT